MRHLLLAASRVGRAAVLPPTRDPGAGRGRAGRSSRDLARIDEIVGRAPLAVGILLVVVFVWAQVRDARVPPFHYALVALAPLTFFLFVAYSARFLSLAAGVFLLPVFKGVAFLSMCFLLALSVLVPLSRRPQSGPLACPRMAAPSPA